ncbi:MAG: anti-sigma regulatory factor [Acidimicrobiales bacterium]|nr:anti-sigma regulatory factor [Acidimicrobiales bacterium]
MNHDEVRLVLPAAPEYARVARLAAAGLATRLGFSYDDVEDLRIAVGEACSILVADGSTGRLTLLYRLHPAILEVEASTNGGGPPLKVAELSEQILGAVVDEHAIDAAGRSIRLFKHHGG